MNPPNFVELYNKFTAAKQDWMSLPDLKTEGELWDHVRRTRTELVKALGMLEEPPKRIEHEGVVYEVDYDGGMLWHIYGFDLESLQKRPFKV